MTARDRERRSVRVYRACLALYPAEFREEYGRELCLVFADRWREERSPAGLARLWAGALGGIVQEAPKEHLHMILEDLRFALRIMRKDAAVTLTALAILALGIGAATLVFSLANGLLVRPLPYADPSRLAAVEEYSPKDPNEFGEMSYLNFLDMASRVRLVENLGVYSYGSATLRSGGNPETVQASEFSERVLPALGVRPVVGRFFMHEESLPKGPKAIILSEELWTRRFNRDPNMVGKILLVNRRNYTVVGVMPASFHFPSRADLWIPLQEDPATAARTDYFLGGIARLKPGVTAGQASAELESILEEIHRQYPAANNNWRARVTPLQTFEAANYRKQVIALLAAVALLLLIACANVSNLLLVKASARGREMAVRAAMGASRRRLVRQLISESMLLGLAGGALGAGLAYAGVPALLRLIPIDLPTWMDFHPDWRVLLFALAASLATSIAFGTAPAFGSSSVDLATALKEGGRSLSGRHKLLRNGLVVAEVALSMILLAGAGLTMRSFVALRSQNLGYQPEHVLSMEIRDPAERYPDGPKARALVQQLTGEISSIPGVTSAAFTTGVPLHDGWTRIYTIEGHPEDLKDMPFAHHIVTSSGYFRTLGIPLLQGRDFTDADYDQPNVLIVTQAFARESWPHESAIGKRVRFGPPKNQEPWHTVIGIVADNKHGDLKTGGRPNVYLPYDADMTPNSLLVRAAGDPAAIASAVRARIHSFDAQLAITHIFTMPELIERASWQDRFLMVLFAGFAAIALALAAAGLYAVLSYAVSLHTREIGIRMALGASAARVRAMLMRQGIALAAAGLAAGAAGALALTRLLASQLFEVSPRDPLTFLATPPLLIAVAALAAFIPARRATRVDPAIALRWE